MAVGEQKRHTLFMQTVQTGNQNHNFIIVALLHAAPSRMNIPQHDRERGEVKWHIIVKRAARWQRYGMVGTLADQFGVAYGDPLF